MERNNDVTDILRETFSAREERFGKKVSINLKPGGSKILVTEENKAEYVDAQIQYQTFKRVQEQFDAFTTGLFEIVPRDLIMIFDERELRRLVSGKGEDDDM